MEWSSRLIGDDEVDPSTLNPNPLNWRVHPQHQRDTLKSVLGEVGWVQRIIVNQRTGNVVDGHARVEEAIAEQQSSIPVTYVDLDENEERLILATLDPLSAMAEQDSQTLQAVIDSLETEDDFLAGVLASLRPDDTGVKPVDQPPPDITPIVEIEPITKKGDIWILGRHRIMCGNSTSRDDVELLSDGVQFHACVTDPPYGLDDTKSEKNNYRIYNDTLDNLLELISAVLPICFELCERSIVTSGIKNIFRYPKSNWIMSWNYTFGLARTPWGFATWQPILCYGKDPKLQNKMGSFPDSVVMNAPSPNDIDHPCPKPVVFWKWLIERVTLEEETIFDPFAGAGTTIVCAEHTKRTAYAMELDPAYVDVSVRRWQDYTGQKATHAETGKEFPSGPR